MVYCLQGLIHTFVGIDRSVHLFEEALQLNNLLVLPFYLGGLVNIN